jgi:hypothetical protein
MRIPKPNGTKYGSRGPTWLGREYLNYLKWYEEVMNSCRNGKRSKKINIGY